MRPKRIWFLAPLLAVAVTDSVVWIPVSHARAVVAAGQDLSNPINAWYLTITYLFLLWRGRWSDRRCLWWALDGIVTATLIIQGLKLITHLPRPSGGLSGFPSGHTTAAFAAAWMVMETMPALGPIWFTVASAIAWSRIETGEHYPYQVIFGTVFGPLLGYLITHLDRGLLFPRIIPKRREKAVEKGDAG